jgi:iron complex outermembrane recepter protein
VSQTPSRTQVRPNLNYLKSALTMSVGLAAFASLSAPAVAQETDNDSPRTMQTVTVTSTKREQTLQDVPVAVSVVDDSVIAKAQITDLNDLQSLVPSLSVGQLQSSSNTNFVIRGFGNGANNAGIEPSVGVFIDGVYRSRSASQISDLPNIERVEVLRGPQSTLFGKNASAGVISVVTKKPSFEPMASVEGTVSNFNGYRGKVYGTGPITDTLAFALGGSFSKRDGYIEDIGDGPDTNERNRYGIRGELLFEPNEDMSFRLIGDYDTIDEICCGAVNVVNGPTGAVINALGGQVATGDLYEVAYNFGSTNNIDNGGLSLQGDFDLGKMTLTSITAYRTTSVDQNADSDFTTAELLSTNANQTDIDTFTQEVRLTSDTDGPIDWMVGGFYFDETVDIGNQIYFGDDFRGYVDFLSGGAVGQIETALGLPVGQVFGQSGQGLTEQFGQDNKAWSMFGTVDWHATDRLTATVGLNYTEDKKDAYGNIANTDVFSGIDFVALGFAQTLGGFGVDATDPAQVGAFAANNPAAFAAIQAAVQDPEQNPLLALQALQFFPPFLNFPNAVEDGKSKDDKLTYTLRLAYDATDNVNVYASYGTGFKATSWNLSRDSRPFASDFTPGSSVTSPGSSPIRDAGLAVNNLAVGTRYAGPELATVIELGAKFAYNTFAVNVALFDQEIEGFQSNTFSGTGFNLTNAGKQSTQGMEVDASWNATENLLLTFAGTFQDPVYDDFTSTGIKIDPSLPLSASNELDLSGQKPYDIPEVATSTSATYSFDVNSLASFVRVDWQYESETDYFDDPANQALINDTHKISTWNASAGFTTENGLGVTVWGRNIFDDEYITVAFPTTAQTGSINGYPSQPPTYGITVRKSF